ncbi:MAG TPA: DUF4260 family protein [Gaiellaceae bacterium]|nr:DUF4260 family protein [Gaiellaceae bacterium]
MEATLVRLSPSFRRLAYAALSVGLLAALVHQLWTHGTGYWQLAAFGAGPDLALLLGAGAGLARGQLHPRAVPTYNLLHRFVGPAALLAAALLAGLGQAWVVAALAWALHVAIDRAVGYGLRTPEGFQRR